MKHQDIVSKVKTILNEHGEEIPLSISDDRVLIKDYIEAAIPDAVVMLAQRGYRVNVVEVIPGEDLQPGLMYDIGEDDMGCYKDADFISLIKATNPIWKKDVTQLTDTNSVEFAMAQNKYTKPKANSPMVWWDEQHGLDYEPYEGNDDEVTDEVTFVYNSKYNPKDGLCYKRITTRDMKVKIETSYRIEPKVVTAVCYMAAALVCGMFGDDDGKRRLSDISTNMLN